MSQVFALVDCNNFFVSCERVFQPALNGKPVVVLSSNDGCVISRSQEAKDLGIPMGEPYFKLRDEFRKHNIKVFSSNFELYGNLSDRVMQTLEQFNDAIEIYSIDEAFLQCEDALGSVVYGQEIRALVKQWAKIPVSVGIAPTKTLAKVANHIAKKQKQFGGVFKLSLDMIESCLATVPVGEVWGIGRASTMFLTKNRITTALDLTRCADDWVKKHLTSRGLFVVRELRGQSCFELEDAPAAKQGITCSRSFGKPVTTLNELKEAVITYTTKAAEKLRAEKEVAGYIHVYIRTSLHTDGRKYALGQGLPLPIATAFTPELIRQAVAIVERIFKPGYKYMKAGVSLSHVSSEDAIQQNLFVSAKQTPKKLSIMKTLDKVNKRYGESTLQYAGAGLLKKWRVKKDLLSPRYTTALAELPKAR